MGCYSLQFNFLKINFKIYNKIKNCGLIGTIPPVTIDKLRENNVVV